ncbi:FAD:protein FMN transferase [Actinomadura scrupuli]|uniref:FAD:protein FMN transferase n=1 Tax=Actinomadura scrupuli TaxID=559629 RepID=UPI003D99B7E6
MDDGLHHVEHVMGTVFSFDLRCPATTATRTALDKAITWLHRMDALFSTYQPDSEISRLARGELMLPACAPEVRHVLALGRRLETETGGWFSLTAAGLLDPNALVKGWAIEQVSTQLHRAGVQDHCVNGGGDIQTRGERSPGEPWRIGVAHPLDRGRLLTVVEGTDLAVATSGITERGAHITDPHTGLPVTDLLSLTLVGHQLTRLDALSTALFAMGETALAKLDFDPRFHAHAVTRDGRHLTTNRNSLGEGQALSRIQW